MNPGVSMSGEIELFDHFSGASEPTWLVTQDTSAAGSPTLAPASAAGGAFELAHDTRDEVQAITLYGGDVLALGGASEPVFEARVKVQAGGGALTATETLVVGLASARNATLDNVVTHFWFKMAGANNNILYEYDDGTTDSDDNDTGVDYESDVYAVLRIDASDLSRVTFAVDGVEVADVDVSETITDANLLQPFIEFQKTGGGTDNGVLIDYLYLRSQVIR